MQMERKRFCVVVPVFNHGLTVAKVVGGAACFFPVIVVNDGSTDGTTEALRHFDGDERVRVLELPVNLGKAGALKAAFGLAMELGFTHAISLDADGQHPVEAVPMLATVSERGSDALVVGVRDLRRACAPRERRFSNGLSNLCFRLETGVALGDTQTGLRCYPLGMVKRLRLRESGYAWELEVLVRAAWAGVPLVEQPVEVDYAAPTSRMSHFNPVRDFLRIGWLHGRFLLEALVLPRAVRARRAMRDGGGG